MKMKNNKDVRKGHATALRDATMKYIEHGVKHWLREKQALDMWEMTTTDAYDLGCVIALIEENEISQEFEKASDLDTAVRDEIPKDVWNWMAFVRQEQLANKEHWARLDDGQKYNI